MRIVTSVLVLVLASLVYANDGEEEGVSGPNPHGYYTYGRYYGYGYGWPYYRHGWYGRRKRSTAEEAAPIVPADESVPSEAEGGPSPHGYYPYTYTYGYGYPHYGHYGHYLYGRRKRSEPTEVAPAEDAGDQGGPNPHGYLTYGYGHHYGHGWPYYSSYHHLHGRKRRAVEEEGAEAVSGPNPGPSADAHYGYYYGHGYPYYSRSYWGYPYAHAWYGRKRRAVEEEGEEAVSGPNPGPSADAHYGYYYGQGYPYYSRSYWGYPYSYGHWGYYG